MEFYFREKLTKLHYTKYKLIPLLQLQLAHLPGLTQRKKEKCMPIVRGPTELQPFEVVAGRARDILHRQHLLCRPVFSTYALKYQPAAIF